MQKQKRFITFLLLSISTDKLLLLSTRVHYWSFWGKIPAVGDVPNKESTWNASSWLIHEGGPQEWAITSDCIVLLLHYQFKKLTLPSGYCRLVARSAQRPRLHLSPDHLATGTGMKGSTQQQRSFRLSNSKIQFGWVSWSCQLQDCLSFCGCSSKLRPSASPPKKRHRKKKGAVLIRFDLGKWVWPVCHHTYASS